MSSLRILIIDDVASIRTDMRRCLCPPISAEQMMSQLIQRHTMQVARRYEIQEARQGREGVEMVQVACQAGQPFHVIIVDMKMPPGIDGMETIRQIRKLDPNAYVIVCTAFSEASDEEMASANGGIMPATLYKPFECDALVAAVNYGGVAESTTPHLR